MFKAAAEAYQGYNIQRPSSSSSEEVNDKGSVASQGRGSSSEEGEIKHPSKKSNGHSFHREAIKTMTPADVQGIEDPAKLKALLQEALNYNRVVRTSTAQCHAKIKQQKDELIEAAQSIENMRGDIVQMDSIVQGYESRNALQKTELSNARREILQLNKELQQVNDVIKGSELLVEANKGLRQEAVTAKHTITSLERRLLQSNQLVVTRDTKLTTLTQQLTTATQRLEAANTAYVDLRLEHTGAMEYINKLKGILHSRDATIATLKSSTYGEFRQDMADADARIMGQAQEIAALKKSLKATEQALSEKTTQNSSLIAEFATQAQKGGYGIDQPTVSSVSNGQWAMTDPFGEGRSSLLGVPSPQNATQNYFSPAFNTNV